MDLLGAAGELGMCGSKEELCLQLLIGVHVYVCVCVCTTVTPRNLQHPSRVGSRIQVDPLIHHRSHSPE